jgi:hypothetical protein
MRFGDSPNDDYKYYSLWGCDALWFGGYVLMFNRNVSSGQRCEESTLAEAVSSSDTFLPKSKLHDMTPQKSSIICLCDKG